MGQAATSAGVQLIHMKALRKLGASPTARATATRVVFVERTPSPITGTEDFPEVPRNLYRLSLNTQVVVNVGRGILGRGLFACYLKRQNELIIEFKVERILRTEMERSEKLYLKRSSVEEYMLAIRDCGVFIDPTVYGNRERFANHSCESNAGFYTVRKRQFTFRLVFVYDVDDIDASA